jgi:CubicO group peptidase (beta-lactamase class C family)
LSSDESDDVPQQGVGPVPVHGETSPRFAPVREAFAHNFAALDEVGAAICVRWQGEVVVDLFGGFQDAARTRPWCRDTLVNVYSVGKGILSGLLMCAVEDGRLSFDDAVAKHWPEFARHGKADVSVRQLASHQAGLPALRAKHALEVGRDWGRMCTLLADEPPFWAPGTRHGYHTNTFGFLVGEVIARVTGLSLPDALRHYMTGPTGADFHYGLPPREHARCADVLAPDVVLETEAQWALAFPATGDPDYDRMRWHTYFNPVGISGMGVVNTAGWRNSVIPSTSGHGTARAVADLYAGMIGSGLSLHVAPGEAVRAEATRGEVEGEDVVLQRPSRFGIGFQLPSPTRPLGPSATSFGHYGYGGSLGFADPTSDLAFGYLMNRPGQRWQTPRTQNLIDAVYACL